MLLLALIPVVSLTAIAHRYLRLYAPSNLVVARLRTASPRWRTAGILLACSILFIIGAHRLEVAVDAGLPPWLNLVVLVLAWDAVKFACLVVAIAARCVVGSVVQGPRLGLFSHRPARRLGAAASVVGGKR